MNRAWVILPVFLLAAVTILLPQKTQLNNPSMPSVFLPPKESGFLGFDRNLYPGDEAIAFLRKYFSFASFWLSPPPGEKNNTWAGKREVLKANGFGFVILYTGRASRELKTESMAREKGFLDATNASAAAKREGFAAGAIIFLDIEEGGRLPAAYHTYLRFWAKQLGQSGYRAGVYCSGIPVKEDTAATITTAEDIRAHATSRDITFWVFNDVCPPSPGCAFRTDPLLPAVSGISFAAVWQFAQTPRRRERTAGCPANYNPDGNCYAPADTGHRWFLDVNSALTPDPSAGRK